MTAAKPLTKSQLITIISERMGMTKKDVTAFLDTLSDIACKEAKKKGSFVLPGFGKLVKVKRKARKGRNPATGEHLILEPRKVITFKCSGKLRDRINGYN